MIQRGRGASFAAEALGGLRIAVKSFGKKFQTDESAKFEIFGLVYHAHTASTKFLEDSIMGKYFCRPWRAHSGSKDVNCCLEASQSRRAQWRAKQRTCASIGLKVVSGFKCSSPLLHIAPHTLRCI